MTNEKKPILKGTGASKGIVEGTVKIVKGAEDIKNFNEGDILVSEYTEPSMVVMMNKSAGIITDTGGLTSHAAIVSRELGVPSVVASKTGTKDLKDGMKVRLDGNTGEVYVLENNNKNYPEWIDQYAISWHKAMDGMTPSNWGPFDYHKLHSSLNGTFITKLHDAIVKIKSKTLSKEEIAKAMPNLSTFRGGLQYYFLEYMGIKDKTDFKNKMKEVTDFLVDILQYMAKEDTFGMEKNIFHSKEEIGKILNETDWKDGDSKSAKELGKLYISLASWSYSLYRDYFPMISNEIYGPYDSSEKFGENTVLMVKHFTNIDPVELWPDLERIKYKDIKIFQVYKNVKFKSEFIGFHTNYEGDIINDLISYAVIADGKVITDIEEIKKISEDIAWKTMEQTKVYDGMTRQELLEKSLEWDCFQFFGLFNLAKMDWHPTKEMIDSLNGADIPDRCILDGWPSYEEYSNSKGQEVYWLKELYE